MNLKQQLRCELARRSFWEYCKTMAGDFYREDRPYLKQICDEMQDFYTNDKQIMLINLPPRHAKSRTATLFIQWILGRDNSLKIMTGSYNETLSTTFSKQVRGAIQEIKADEDKLVYSDIFPTTKIKYGDGASNLWSLEGQTAKNYLATSPTGTATGFGADIIIVDDLIKNAQEAHNATILGNHWDWFTNTMMSRLQGLRKVIIIMTRWASKDLAGRAKEHFEDIGVEIQEICMKAYDGDKMLCDDILNKEQYNMLIETLGEDIAEANYNQSPIDLKGCLYSDLKTYSKLPENIRAIENYTDTADTGEDYLCSIDYVVDEEGDAYILDVVYTQEAMEITEPLVAEMITKDAVNFCRIESNNGGRGFCRNVKKEAQQLGNKRTVFKPFTQRGNKISRILTASTSVMNRIYFPEGWHKTYKEFYRDVTQYQRQGKNKHDDSVDVLSGIIEVLESKYNKKNLSRLRL